MLTFKVLVCDWPDCDAEYDDASPTGVQIRRLAGREGWTRVEGGDRCPLHPDRPVRADEGEKVTDE